MKTKQTLLIMALSLMAFATNAQLQYISNITVAQRADASGLVDVHFDMVAIPANDYYISFSVSFDTGNTFNAVPREFITGDTGPISPGTGYHIVWDGLASFPETYGPQSQLKIYAVSCPETVTDIDGNVYQTVPIGSQCWMKENLNVTKNPSGTSITRFCYFDFNSFCNDYGGLYTWDVMMNGSGSSNNNPSGVQGICPNGWHIPSDAEWTQLTHYIGGTQSPNGNKLKSCRQINSPLGGECSTSEHPRWEQNDTHYGNDLTGFSALPGVNRADNGGFGVIGHYGYWWSSEEYGSYAWSRSLLVQNGSFDRCYLQRTWGLSVRCLRD